MRYVEKFFYENKDLNRLFPPMIEYVIILRLFRRIYWILFSESEFSIWSYAID